MTTTTPTGTVEHIDPNLIVVEANVRSEVTLPREFVDSIKENGVLTPIPARRDAQGNVIVRAGQRRTLAAREAGVATIPAYIITADETTTDRIIQQMVENDQREAVTAADRMAAFQQLAFEGLTPAVIAKRTGTKTATVKAGIAVAGSPTAAAAISSHPLTLAQAAVLIEFEGDAETIADLIDTATNDPAQFAHAAQRARDDARIAANVAVASEDLAARGYTILDNTPSWSDTTIARVRDLSTVDGAAVTEADIVEVEGRAAHVYGSYNNDDVTTIYYLTNYKAAGFKSRNGTDSNSGPMTEEQKAERKILIANNKAWDSAQVVRRSWLTEFFSRKALPRDTATVIAQGLTTHHREVGPAVGNGNDLAHVFLNVERGDYWSKDKLSTLLEQSPNKAQHITLAIILGGIEDCTSRETWRRPNNTAAMYFSQLAVWGYALSDVELIVANSFGEPDTAASTGDDDPED